MSIENENDHLRAFLLIDIGSSHTTAVLLDQVAGSFRLIARGVAPTTHRRPWSNVLYGVQHAIKRLVSITGRALLTEQGELMRPMRPSGAGVDFCALTVSAAAPLKTIVAGLLDDVSVASARHALNTTYAVEVDQVSLADPRTESSQIAAIQRSEPDLILISGGTDGAANSRLQKLLETVAIGVSLINGTRKPEIIFAGNASMRESAVAMLGSLATLRVAENVRPTLDFEETSSAAHIVQKMYQELQVGSLLGIDELTHWAQTPIQPTATAVSKMIGYFSELYNQPVLGIDLGGSSATLISANQGLVQTAVRSDLGTGRPLSRLLDHVSFEEARRFYPEPIDEGSLRNFIFQRALTPNTIPATDSELRLEQALARVTMRCLYEETTERWRWSEEQHNQHSIIVARGRTLTQTPRPGQTLLMLLDALQPTGIFTVVVDKYDVLPALGTLTEIAPLTVVQTLEHGALYNLGWVVAPTGQGQKGQKALSVIMSPDEGGSIEVEVTYGSIEVLPLPTGRSAEIQLIPSRRLNVGAGPGRKKKISITGGAVGLVIDARGRPLTIGDDQESSFSLLKQWQWDMGG